VIEVTQAVTSDLFGIDLQPVQLEDVKEMGYDYQLMIDQASLSATLRFETGEIVAILGLIIAREGCASVWSLISKSADSCGISLTRTVHRMIDLVSEKYSLRRMDMLVREDFKEHVAWAMHLGFLNETPYGIKNYGPNGESYLLMARYW
jgi:hypothetical protein